MVKFRVYGLWTASKYLGEVEASSKEEAERMVDDGEALQDKCYETLCYQCAGRLDLGDMYRCEAELVEEA